MQNQQIEMEIIHLNRFVNSAVILSMCISLMFGIYCIYKALDKEKISNSSHLSMQENKT